MSLVEVAGVVVKEIGASLGSGLIPAFLVGLLVAGLVMVAQEPGEKPGFKKGIESLLTDKRHVRLILLAGYCYLLLDRTIFSREMEWGGLKYALNDWWFLQQRRAQLQLAVEPDAVHSLRLPACPGGARLA